METRAKKAVVNFDNGIRLQFEFIKDEPFTGKVEIFDACNVLTFFGEGKEHWSNLDKPFKVHMVIFNSLPAIGIIEIFNEKHERKSLQAFIDNGQPGRN